MKTILIPTDFSAAADNAARYALQLGKCIQSNVTLFNAVNIPEDAPMATVMAWPAEDYQTTKMDIDRELQIFAKRLSIESARQKDDLFKYQPEVNYCCTIGNVPDVARDLTAADRDICLVAMGLKNSGTISRFLAGSTTRDVIDKADCPLLIIPPAAKFKKINTIAFATDLKDDEIGPIHSVVSLARHFNAELLLVHIKDEHCNHKAYELKVSNFLATVCDKANYPHIYYRDVKNKDVELGLGWLLDHRELEILAMVHLKHDAFERLFDQSHTQHMARNSDLPVLVFPANAKQGVF